MYKSFENGDFGHVSPTLLNNLRCRQSVILSKVLVISRDQTITGTPAEHLRLLIMYFDVVQSLQNQFPGRDIRCIRGNRR